MNGGGGGGLGGRTAGGGEGGSGGGGGGEGGGGALGWCHGPQLKGVSQSVQGMVEVYTCKCEVTEVAVT